MTRPAWGGRPPTRELPDPVRRAVGNAPVATVAWRGALRVRAARRGAAGWRGPTTEAPVLLLTQPRTGSGLLAEHVVRVLGEGDSAGEVLHPHAPMGAPGRVFRVRPLHHVAWSLAAGGPRRGVAVLHVGHLQRAGVSLDDLARRWPDAALVATYRRGLGDMYISGVVARITRQWALRPGETPRRPEPFVVPRSRLERFVAETTRAFDDVVTHPVVRRMGAAVAYEDVADDPGGVFDRQLFPLFGTPPVPIAPPTRRRQRDYEMADVVANLDEVADLLAAAYDPPAHGPPEA